MMRSLCAPARASLRRPCFLSVLVASVAALSPGQAATMVWTGVTNGVWNTGSNWDGGVVPGAADTAEFYESGAGNLDVALSANSTIDGLSFHAGATDPVTIHVTNAARLTLDGGAATDISVLAGAHVIEGAGAGSGESAELITAGANQLWHVAEGATLAINAKINTAAFPANNTTYAKTGAGILALGGDNGGTLAWNFPLGVFEVMEGTLRMTHRNAGGHGQNDFTVQDGATLEITGAANRYISTNGLLRLRGAGMNGVGALYVSTGDVATLSDGTGGIFLQAHTTIGVSPGSTFVVAQDITETGVGNISLTKSGAGLLVLTSDESTYSGATVVDGGTLQIDASLSGTSGAVVNATGTLAGGGVLVNGITLNDGGSIAPGGTNALDSEFAAGSLLWNAGGILEFDVGTDSDLLELSGALTKGGSGTYEFVFDPDEGFGPGVHPLITFTSTNFAESDFSLSGLDPAVWTFELTETSLNLVIPEPASFGLVLPATALVLARRRRGREGPWRILSV